MASPTTSPKVQQTDDTTIVDLAIGWDVGQLEVGAFARGARMAKWSAVLRIEDQSGADATLAGRVGAWPPRSMIGEVTR